MSRVFLRNFKGDSGVFQGNFMFLIVCFKEVTTCLKEVLRMLPGNFKVFIIVFQG